MDVIKTGLKKDHIYNKKSIYLIKLLLGLKIGRNFQRKIMNKLIKRRTFL